MIHLSKGSFVLAAMLFFGYSLQAQRQADRITRSQYIETYKNIAMQKMQEYGIPASITIAQGILESGDGNSVLAQQANNHFGIKCHDWTGPTFRWDDDEKNECFRKYKNPEESFHDHSLFLTRRPRYSKLFELDVSDYKAWAHELKRAGYATNPQYAHILIRIIEENRLFEFDQEVLHGPKLLTDVPVEPDFFPQAASFQEFGSGPNNRKIYLNNRRIFVFARADDTFFKIANDFDMNLARIANFNDASIDAPLTEGAMVYLEHKRRRSAEKTHLVKQGETLHGIAQLYAIKLKMLERHNGISSSTPLQAGQTVKLRAR
jgi:hypothetical protein